MINNFYNNKNLYNDKLKKKLKSFDFLNLIQIILYNIIF